MTEIVKDMRRRTIWPAFISLIFFGCTLNDDPKGIKVLSIQSDLTTNQDEWTGDFTGYPTPEDSIAYELKFAYTDLPPNLGAKKGVMLSGNDIDGDGLFMFIKNKVTGLTPNTEYALVFEVQLASNASSEIDDENGSPGGSVFLKAGASSAEPNKIIGSSGCELNIDKGSVQSLPGSDLIVLGNIAVGTQSTYQLINRGSTNFNAPLRITTNSNGEFWLIIGTDSAYKGTTTVYYTQVNVILTVPD